MLSGDLASSIMLSAPSLWHGSAQVDLDLNARPWNDFRASKILDFLDLRLDHSALSRAQARAPGPHAWPSTLVHNPALIKEANGDCTFAPSLAPVLASLIDSVATSTTTESGSEELPKEAEMRGRHPTGLEAFTAAGWADTPGVEQIGGQRREQKTSATANTQG